MRHISHLRIVTHAVGARNGENRALASVAAIADASMAMGLLLYTILLFFGARGMPLKRASLYCLITAVLLAVLAIAAIEDLPSCEGIGCSRSAGTLAVTLLTNLALAFGSFGIGVGSRRLVARFKKA